MYIELLPDAEAIQLKKLKEIKKYIDYSYL